MLVDYIYIEFKWVLLKLNFNFAQLPTIFSDCLYGSLEQLVEVCHMKKMNRKEVTPEYCAQERA